MITADKPFHELGSRRIMSLHMFIRFFCVKDLSESISVKGFGWIWTPKQHGRPRTDARSLPNQRGSLMALIAVLGVLHVEGLAAVVALSAEIALRDLAHFHLVGALRHLEHGVMTARALESLVRDMLLMTEDDRFRALGAERQVASPHLVR